MVRMKGSRRHGGWPSWQERLAAGLETPTVFGCWTWRGKVKDHGYATLSVDGKQDYVHRLMYALAFGPIPEGLTIDHLCRNRACANPFHLEAVPRLENVARGRHPAAVAMRTDMCQRGHSAWKQVAIRGRPSRQCRICQNEANRLRRQGTRAA